MARYYYKCVDCDKKIKKNPEYVGEILCQQCKKNRRIKYCLNCNKKIIGGKSIRKYCSTSCSSSHTLKNKPKSKEHKEKLSKAAWNNRGNGYAKVRYFKVYCPYLKKDISVQGTYELRYGNYLNENNILWTRGKKISLQYKRDGEDIIRNYYPDFYLVKENIYIETKGYYSDSDKEKMKRVNEYNPNIKIKMISKEDIEMIRTL